MEGTEVGMLGIGVGIFGLIIAYLLFKKVDSIEIKNETVAKITGRIQDGAMAFLFAEYKMLSMFIAAVALVPSIIINNTLDSSGTGHGGGAGGFAFGGISLLIASGVALETMKQIDSQLMMRNYEGFLK